MSGEAVLFTYLGAVGTIFLLNAVQWSFFRDWVYGLFTLQTLLWFLHSIFNRTLFQHVTLSESQNIAVYAGEHGLIIILYLELVCRLFDVSNNHPPLGRWLRWAQSGLGIYLLAEIGMLVTDEVWQQTPTGWFVSTLYWILLMVTNLAGVWIAAVRRDAIGWFFAAGSLFMLTHTANTLFYYTGYPWTLSKDASDINLYVQILGAIRISGLLCFSLSLVFRQRQIAVAQAIEQTRRAEQFVQERLEAELAVRRLEQEKTDVQLRALQAQVNPHFLFNSLNSLSSLIDDDPERANQFVDQLSLVYRYLLKANDQPLTTLASELDFIQSYYHLLKTRHGNGLTLSVQIDPDYERRLLPPLTLQLLVENAVKHNTILAARPLRIDILTDEAGYLVLSNNLQRKRTSTVLSNGIGLSTIRAQYQKLDQPAPVIIEEEDKFTVRIPLI